MEPLLYLALLVAGLFVMMRFGGGAHMAGHGHGGHEGETRPAEGLKNLRWVPPREDTDPVCGKTVIPDKAKSSIYDGQVYYFCSRECREAFEVVPVTHVGRAALPKSQPMECSHGHHH